MSRRTVYFVILPASIAVFLLCFSCHVSISTRSTSTKTPKISGKETTVQIPVFIEGNLPLKGISGLAWYNETLIMLPRYPGTHSSPKVFTIQKVDILKSIADVSPEPIQVMTADLVDDGTEEGIDGFEGYEAIAFHGKHVYMTIKARSGDTTNSYIVSGETGAGLNSIRLKPSTIRKIPPQTTIPGISYTSLFVVDNEVVVINEANGDHVNKEPSAHIFDTSATLIRTIGYPPVEYRITDVCEPDTYERFWAINTYDPTRENTLKPGTDILSLKYGKAVSCESTVERIVEFQFNTIGISWTSTPPIILEPAKDNTTHKWEGLARLDDKGFLLITDSESSTILAFVPKPGEKPDLVIVKANNHRKDI